MIYFLLQAAAAAAAAAAADDDDDDDDDSFYKVRPLNSCLHKFQDGSLSIAVLVFQIAAFPTSGKVHVTWGILPERAELADVQSRTAVEWKTTCMLTRTQTKFA